MEIKITSKQIFTVLLVLAWIIFVGLSIEAGGFLCNAFFTLVLNPEGAKHFWKLVDLSAVYNSNKTYFITKLCQNSLNLFYIYAFFGFSGDWVTK